jgi:hypothetical protein
MHRRRDPARGSPETNLYSELLGGEMKVMLKMIEQLVYALAQKLAPQKPVVTGNYLARRDAMRRWENHWYENRY